MKLDDLRSRIKSIKEEFNLDLNRLNTEKLKSKYLSKSSVINNLTKQIPQISSEDKRTAGELLNKIKKEVEKAIKAGINEAGKTKSIDFDYTIPGEKPKTGNLHPTTQTIREMNNFFRYYGFSVMDGPEIETEEYNFRRLNLPEGHPATDLQDTLFIKEPNLLLRTHTSSVEARVLSDYKPPIRVVIPGKCYRNEVYNSTNGPFFHQYQGVVVDKGITIENLFDVLTLFHQYLYGENVELRFRYKYYPEVSPGVGTDMKCGFCQGKGCSVCKHRGWIEVLGSGMIHYNTLKMCGIDPEEYTGFAFGMGLDRLVMQRYGIDDLRKLYGGQLVYKEN